VLIDELLDFVTVFPDHLEVTVGGAPPLNVLYGEVGLKESETVRVGGGTAPLRTRIQLGPLNSFLAVPEDLRGRPRRGVGLVGLMVDITSAAFFSRPDQ
jgi:hypothetical protein